MPGILAPGEGPETWGEPGHWPLWLGDTMAYGELGSKAPGGQESPSTTHNAFKLTTVCPHLTLLYYLSYACSCLMSRENFKFSPFQPLPSRPEFPAGQHSPSCLPWGLAKLVWPMAIPREDGDGVGPKGEGALRAPLGEPEVWMFPVRTHTHQRARQTQSLTSSP